MTGIWLVSYIVLWVLVLILAVAVVLMLRSLSVVIERVHHQHQDDDATPTKLRIGELVPDVPLYTSDGTMSSLHSWSGVHTAVIVVSPGCGPCQEVVTTIKQAQSAQDPLALQVSRTMLICTGTVEEAHQDLAVGQLATTLPVLIDVDREVGMQWGLRATPTTVIVDNQWHLVRVATGFLPLPLHGGTMSAGDRTEGADQAMRAL